MILLILQSGGEWKGDRGEGGKRGRTWAEGGGAVERHGEGVAVGGAEAGGGWGEGIWGFVFFKICIENAHAHYNIC